MMKNNNTQATGKSKFLLTLLFRTSFFKRMRKEEILAFLIPYIDGYGNPFPMSRDGVRTKLKMLNDGILGGQIQNVASQGFALNSLHSQSITFPYYYEQLSDLAQYLRKEHDKHEKATKDDSGEAWDSEDANIESVALKQSLQEILMLPILCFSRKHEVYDKDKHVLLEHLNQHGNQYVLAELLYYITSANHELPNVDIQIRDWMAKKLPEKILTPPNVSCKLRLDFDETPEEMIIKLDGVKQLRILCLSGSTFFNEREINNLSFFSVLKSRLEAEKPIDVQVIFQSSDSKSAIEAAKNRMAPNCPKVSKIERISNSILGFTTLRKQVPTRVCGKSTNIQSPYSLSFFYFYEKYLDYVKVDIYSPLISSDDNRPSLIVFRRTDEELFKHFEETFLRIWNNETESSFLERE